MVLLYTDDKRVIFPYLIEKGVSFTLDLNGHSIEYDGVGTLFEIETGGSLTIKDSQTKNYTPERIESVSPNADDIGSLSGNTLIYYTTESPTGQSGTYGEAVTIAKKHTLNMESRGKLYSQNTDPARLTDSLVQVNGGTFTLESGILDNRGGMRNILSLSGTVTMTGGYVIGAQTSSGGNGGGIFVARESSDITISGGVIAANQATSNGNGGGIYSNCAANIIVTGNAVISGNTAGQYGGGIGNGGTGDIRLSGNASIACNRSGANGGGVSHTGSGKITVGGSGGRVTVSCNTAADKGGGLSNLRASDSGSTISILDGAVISYNKSDSGGGISGKFMVVDGGTIDHNTAGHVGGGLFVASGRGYAKLSATDSTKVYVTNNTARDTSGVPHAYAGGGIFVEHPTQNAGSTIQSRLLVTNALITENHAMYGGGIGSCGTSELYDFDIKGAAIFGNTASLDGGVMDDWNTAPRRMEIANSQDIYCASNNSLVSKTMIGMDDTASWSGLKGPYEQYVTVNDSEWGSARNHKFNEPIYLTATVDPATQEREKGLAGVIISGNRSGSGGGGIGGNGHIQLGVERALIIEKHVESFIEADKNTLFNFQIDLTQNDSPLTGIYVYTIVRKNGTSATHEFSGGTVTLQLSDGDRATIYGLPEEDTSIFYTVTELLEGTDNFTTTVDGPNGIHSSDNSRVVTGQIDKDEAETLKFTNHKLMSVTVKKEWIDKDGKPEADIQHDTIEVELLRRKSKKETFQSFPDDSNSKTIAELSDQNSWEHIWTSLDGTYEYLVSEIKVPEGYTSIKTVSEDRKTRTLTNAKEVTKLTVKKEWNAPSDNLIPDSVKVVLIGHNAATGTTKSLGPVELNVGNKWTHTWEDLKPGYTWRVEEVDIPEGYTYRTEVRYDSTESDVPIIIINTYVPPKGSITLQKRWLDNNTSSDRLPKIEVQLLQNGDVIREATLNSENDWRVRWNDLDVQDRNGNRYEYTVHEVSVPEGYLYSGDRTFTLEKDRVSEISITNTAEDFVSDPGRLTLSKRVTGTQTDQEFTFLFELRDKNGASLIGSYPYTEPGTGEIKYVVIPLVQPV